MTLVGFGLLEAPYNVAAMFVNGLSLGCTWGVIFSFIEGRKVTDILASLFGVSMDQCILNTPRMDYSGSVRLTFITRALKSTWTDEEGKLMEDGSAHLIVGISDEQGRKIETNQTTSNLADLQMYEDMGWSEVTMKKNWKTS